MARKSKLLKVLPFMPIVVTLLVSAIYIINFSNNEILFSPPSLSPDITFNFTLTILTSFLVSVILMLIIFYYLTKKEYY